MTVTDNKPFRVMSAESGTPFQLRVDIPKIQALELSRRANEAGLSRSALIRNLINAYLGDTTNV